VIRCSVWAPILLVASVACGPKVNPLQADLQALRRVASAGIEANPPRHVSMRVSSEVLGELVFLGLENGADGQGNFTFPTPAGQATLRVSPQEIRDPIRLTQARCDGCVRVEGTVTGTVRATMGPVNVNPRAGLHTAVPVQVRAVTQGQGSDIVITPRWDRATEFDVQLMGLPLGGMGLNRQLTTGLREEFDGQDIVVASLPASSVFPVRSLSVQAGETAHVSLRVVGATEAPLPPRRLSEGVWIGVSVDTARAWFDAYSLRRRTKKWAFRPSTMSGDDNTLTATLDVWRLRSRPKLRQFDLSISLVESGGRWTVGESSVTRRKGGLDVIGGIIRGQIQKRIDAIVDDDLLTGGVVALGSQTLRLQVDDLAIDDGTIEVRLDVSRP
jgi:hypothetical protein